MNQQLANDLNDKLDFLIIGHNATSYKLPLIVAYIKEWDDKICIDCKNIKGKYIVFDKQTFIDAVEKYNNKDNNNDKDEKT